MHDLVLAGIVLMVGIALSPIVRWVGRWIDQERAAWPRSPQPAYYTFDQWMSMDEDTRNAILGYELMQRANRIAASADAAAWMAFWIALDQ